MIKYCLSQNGIPHGSAEEDPWCNASSPHRLHFEDITSAAFKVKNGILVTPCMVSRVGIFSDCHQFELSIFKFYRNLIFPS